MKTIFFFMKKSRGIVALAMLAGMVSGGASTGLVVLVHQAMGDGDFSMGLLAAGFAGLCVLMVLSQISSDVLLLRLVQKSIYELRIEMSRKILASPLRKLEDIGPHRLLATISGDIRRLADTISLAPLIAMNLAILLGCLVYMAYLSWIVFFGATAMMVPLTLMYQTAANRGGVFLARARETADEVYGALRGLTEGTKELKLHHRRRQAFLEDILGDPAARLRGQVVQGMTIFRVAGTLGRLMFLVLIALLLFALPQFMTIDRFVLNGFVLSILYMVTPMTALLSTLPALGTANVALRKIEQLGLSLDEDGEEEVTVLPSATGPTSAGPAATALPAASGSWRSLQLAAATHTYWNEKEGHSFTLGPIDLELEAGETVFLVGGNGCGKTTLAKLLVGLYRPESGEVLLDGEAVTDENLERFRQHFSMVFTDFFLFDQLLGIEGRTVDDQARRYLVDLELDHKVKIKDGRLSTTKLSQGQRKRLALLTAYLEDRPIYVFDEWAADQDPQFKKVFYHKLLPDLKARGKTAIVISHDDHYYAAADRLVKLDSGQIESDSKRELAASVSLGA
ncbi:MAG: cyclic peptide export ABC transporter [Acidobacteriota bacterium]